MRFLNDYGQEIAESDIDNASGDPAKMMSGAIIDIESDTDETILDDILQEVADYEGINLAIV